MSATERTPLTRLTDTPDYVEFASLLRTRRTRIQNVQCCVYIFSILIFTTALILTIAYSTSDDDDDDDESVNGNTPNLTSGIPGTLQTNKPTLKMKVREQFPSYTYFGSTAATNYVFNPESSVTFAPFNELSEEEEKEALIAGQQAVASRLSADAAALASPLPSPSPESRHRWAVSTGANVGAFAVAAIAELAATKRIENARTRLGEPSAVGCFFNGGWAPQGSCKEFFPLACTIGKYRSIDGTCNRPREWGSALTPFRRVLPPDYADGIESPRRARSGNELPSAREVSLKVHKPSPSANPSFTVMVAVFGQFLDHDITATAISQGVNGTSISCCPPSVGHPECYPVPVGPGDSFFEKTGRTCMEFVRSAPAPRCKLAPREQLNQVTAFIDGSVIYGSDVKTEQEVREFIGGRLRMQTTPDNRTLLPPSLNPNDGCNRLTESSRGRYCFSAGDRRANENLHLTTMHLIWARQHNMIADGLAAINPTWTDEEIYQEARRIVGAQLQHITYNEFVPIILGDMETDKRELRPLIVGYRNWSFSADDLTNDPTIANNFASAAFRFAHTLIPGLMRLTNSQEGTSSYVELHRMLFNPYSLYAADGVQSSVISATTNLVQRTTTHVTSQLTSHLFEDPIENKTVPCGLDLVSLNIQRGRDHGLPGYTKWREFCNLRKVTSFDELIEDMDPLALDAIRTLYESVDDVDLYTGALAEVPRNGGIVGPTFTCLIADQFVRLQKGDRFWYEVPSQPHSFTQEQLQELRKTSLARIICDCSDGITSVQAEVMRSVGADNPMVSCNDIPALSFEMWKDDRQRAPLLKQVAAAPLPVDWLSFKKTLNDTIRDVVAFINSTRATIPPTATVDWLSFGNELNNTFSEIRSELNGLHPTKKAVETGAFGESGFILRGTLKSAMFTDWIDFKSDLLKSLNDSISGIGSIPPTGADWMAFKANLLNGYFDLKSQIISAKADLYTKLWGSNKTVEMIADKQSIKAIAPIFDWKNFKGDIVQSIDDAIMNIGSNMPAPGDVAAWSSFGDDMKARFAALRDKVASESSTVPTELAAEGADVPFDWLTIKANILKTVKGAVENIENDMPPPGDTAAWLAYQNKIMQSFSTIFPNKTETPVAKKSAPPQSSSFLRAVPAATGKPTSKELSTLTVDWFDFIGKINASVTQAVEDIKAKNPSVADPIGWIMFGNSIKSQFADLKDELADIKTEWKAKIASLKNSSIATPTVQAKAPGKFGKEKAPGKKVPPAIIPADDWIAFKKQINDTVMNLLDFENATAATWASIGDNFAKSFGELKNEITALKNMTANTPPNVEPASDWVAFRTDLNSTVNDFVQKLQNETTVADTMKILFDAKDKFAVLEPPVVGPLSIEKENWASYFLDINATIAGILKNVTDSRRTMTLKVAQSSSSTWYVLKHWNYACYLALCTVSTFLHFATLKP